MRVDLDSSGHPVKLPNGYQLRAPGLDGTVEVHKPAPGGGVRSVPGSPGVLEQALARAEFREEATLELTMSASPRRPARDVRGPGNEAAMELRVPRPRPTHTALVLAVDETGAASWHFPADVDSRGTRSEPQLVFRIPRRLPPPARQDSRFILGLAGKKLLKVLLFPVADAVVGPITHLVADRLEQRFRPYRLRAFAPDNYREPDGPPADWDALLRPGRRALLFIHGTFSRAHSGFGGLPENAMARLTDAYGGGVFALDHPTVSVTPRDNCDWFLRQLPPGAELDLDIICHSRGGLVARTLAERFGELDAGGRVVRVGRVVFVATPNQGTPLANGDYMVKFLDRFTTALNLESAGAAAAVLTRVADALDGVLLAVKLLGHAGLEALPGLAAMRPGDEGFQAWLNGGQAPAGSQYYAISSDYDPAVRRLSHLIMGAADAIVDAIFQDEPNDLVVPTSGVAAANGSPNFPIAGDRVYRFPRNATVMHTNFFAQPETAGKLLEWLPGQ